MSSFEGIRYLGRLFLRNTSFYTDGVLDLSSLQKAVASLQRALVRAKADAEDTELRDACIQRFEYTFELAWKMLKRQLEAEIENKVEVDSYSKKTLFRIGAERGLIGDPKPWFNYLDKRNLTTHTYDESNAQLVYSVVNQFMLDTEDFLKRLQERGD